MHLGVRRGGGGCLSSWRSRVATSASARLSWLSSRVRSVWSITACSVSRAAAIASACSVRSTVSVCISDSSARAGSCSLGVGGRPWRLAKTAVHSVVGVPSRWSAARKRSDSPTASLSNIACITAAACSRSYAATTSASADMPPSVRAMGAGAPRGGVQPGGAVRDGGCNAPSGSLGCAAGPPSLLWPPASAGARTPRDCAGRGSTPLTAHDCDRGGVADGSGNPACTRVAGAARTRPREAWPRARAWMDRAARVSLAGVAARVALDGTSASQSAVGPQRPSCSVRSYRVTVSSAAASPISSDHAKPPRAAETGADRRAVSCSARSAAWSAANVGGIVAAAAQRAP